MPIAAMSDDVIPALAMTSLLVSNVVRQISIGSCSTHPESGKCWANSFCDWPHILKSLLKSMLLEDVVP